MQTPKYHIYIEYAEPDKTGYRYNLPKEELQRTFTQPYIEGKPFWFQGRLLNPLKVTRTLLFWSYEPADKVKLPNQETLLAAKDKKYAADAIQNSKVKGVYVCTEKYLTKPQTIAAPASKALGSAKRRVIVACGSDDQMKEALLWALGKLWLVPVVLCEEPGHGRKIVSRYQADYADTDFAVVLLSPDDYVYAKGEEPTKRKLKPSQEVTFEMGFLLGKLGKDRVLVIFRESEKMEFEVNTEFEGVKSAPFDALDSWKLALIRELTACGYSVEGDRILK